MYKIKELIIIKSLCTFNVPLAEICGLPGAFAEEKCKEGLDVRSSEAEKKVPQIQRQRLDTTFLVLTWTAMIFRY